MAIPIEIKMIAIPRSEYDQLIEDQKWLRALEAAGVDNWEGIDIARESLDD
jgi:hypothetical protein